MISGGGTSLVYGILMTTRMIKIQEILKVTIIEIPYFLKYDWMIGEIMMATTPTAEVN